MDDQQIKGLRPRFSLRRLLMALAVIGIATTYLLHLSRWSAAREAFLSQPEVYDCSESNHWQPHYVRPWPPGGLALVGEQGVMRLAVPNEAQLSEARRLFPEAKVIVAHFYFGRVMIR